MIFLNAYLSIEWAICSISLMLICCYVILGTTWRCAFSLEWYTPTSNRSIGKEHWEYF